MKTDLEHTRSDVVAFVESVRLSEALLDCCKPVQRLLAKRDPEQKGIAMLWSFFTVTVILLNLVVSYLLHNADISRCLTGRAFKCMLHFGLKECPLIQETTIRGRIFAFTPKQVIRQLSDRTSFLVRTSRLF